MVKGCYFLPFLVLILCGINACEEAELSPRTNPRFSVAFVQEIDNTGAQFSANIYDYGSETISEYGFLYSTEAVPRFDNSEVVKGSGKPDRSFSLKATHSMVSGNTYFVVAYLKTTNDVVFSQPYEFKSLGSAGFVFEKFEHKEQIYFGDTIKVLASNLSQTASLYSVHFDRLPVAIGEITDDYFTFIIPSQLPSKSAWSWDTPYHISIEIAKKKMEFEVFLPFAEAEFTPLPVQYIDFGGTVRLKGRYLRDGDISIYTSTKPGDTYGHMATILHNGDDSIAFQAGDYPGEHVNVTIRGKKYNLGPDVFKLNPTEPYPGQQITTSYYSSFAIKGSNFNVGQPSLHQGVIDGQEVFMDAYTEDKESLTITLYSGDAIFGRTAKFQLTTLGKTSQNHVTLTFTDVALPVMKSNSVSSEAWQGIFTGNVASYQGMGYMVDNRHIYEVDPTKKIIRQILALPTSYQHLGYSFSVAQGEKLYFGGGGSYYDSDRNRRFFEFNMRTRQLRRLPDLSAEQALPLFVHIDNNYLYIEGANPVQGIEAGYDSGLRFKFDLRQEKWTPLEDKRELRTVTGRTLAFDYGAKHLAVGNPDGTGDEGAGLYEFDRSTERWRLVKYLGMPSLLAHEVFVINNKAYLLSNDLKELNLETWELKTVANVSSDLINCSGARIPAFIAHGKIYIYDCANLIHELDPTYFKY